VTEKLVPKLSAFLRKLIFGSPFGETFPARANPPPVGEDGRTPALRILRRYFSELVFARRGERDPDTGKVGSPVRFQIPEKNIFIEFPDNPDKVAFPALVFLSTDEAEYDSIGLTAYVEEATRDVYAPGTVIQWQYEFVEEFAVEVWASSRAERRAVLAGVETALVPTELMYGVRFTMPEYYNELVCFTAVKRLLADDDNAARNRRTARVVVQMRFNVVSLINYSLLDVRFKTNVNVDEDSNVAIVFPDRDAPAVPKRPDLAVPLLPCDPFGDVQDQ